MRRKHQNVVLSTHGGQRARRKKTTSWVHVRAPEAQTSQVHWAEIGFAVLFAGLPSGRVAMFVVVILHLPSHTRTSTFELTVHSELAGLCSRVRVHSRGCMMCVYMPVFVRLIILFSWSLGETPSVPECRDNWLTVPVPWTSSHIMSWVLKTWCLQIPTYSSLMCSTVLF